MNPTQKSLLEQMEVHDFEIARRKELLGFTTYDAQLLAACRDFIESEVEAIVTMFYEKQTAVDEIALIIGDIDTLTRLRSAMVRYVEDLFSGLLRRGVRQQPAAHRASCTSASASRRSTTCRRCGS